MKSPRDLPAPGPLPTGGGALFLTLRRGVPLLVALGAFLSAALHHAGRGWWLLLGTTALASLWPSLLRGQAFLRRHRAILRQDTRWAHAFRPLARALGLEEAWIQSFCAQNNQRVRGAFADRKARRALILLPHCIQFSRCSADILGDLQTCYDCGLCPVGDLLEATLRHRWELRITNRSHKAYREAREHRPDLVVAVSCHDRLLKGLTKLTDVPTYVLPLRLPHAMCVDTDFDVPHLFAAMEALVEPRRPEGAVVPLHAERLA